MRKLFLLPLFVMVTLMSVNAQDGEQTSQGNWLVEINTGFGESSTSNTAFSFRSTDGITAWSIGGEAGYFVADDLAIKAGLGYSNFDVDGLDSQSAFNWKIGAKYYISGQFPVGVDLNGASSDGFSPLYLGLQAGYAWFVADNVSIEPGIRYGYGLNEEAGDGDFNIFGVNVGFNIFF